MNFLKKSALGIDIGTDAIKIVEISVFGSHKKLENYGEVKSSLLSKESLLKTNEKGELVSELAIAQGIRAIVREAGMSAKKVIFSLPDFLTFAAAFEIPPMPEKEIAGAVYYSASRYLTLPVSEVTLDWQVIGDPVIRQGGAIKIFLNAVPNKVIKSFEKIAELASLQLYALEFEVFGLARIFTANIQHPVCIVDMGVKTSTISIVAMGQVVKSYSFSPQKNQWPISSNVKLTMDPLFSEIKNACDGFLAKEQRPVKFLCMTGGATQIPGVAEYAKEHFEGSVTVPNCFSGIRHSAILEKSLLEMSTRFSVAAGVALFDSSAAGKYN